MNIQHKTDFYYDYFDSILEKLYDIIIDCNITDYIGYSSTDDYMDLIDRVDNHDKAREIVISRLDGTWIIGHLMDNHGMSWHEVCKYLDLDEVDYQQEQQYVRPF